MPVLSWDQILEEKLLRGEGDLTGRRSLVYHALSSADSSRTMIRPKHVGPVMCLTSPGDGLFVAGGQDGTLRNGILSKRQQQLTRRRRTTTMLEMVAVHKSRPSVITH